MKLRTYFGILVVLLMLLLAYVLDNTELPTSTDNLVVGGGIVLIAIFLFFFYSRCVKSFHIISSGMDLLREQDFGSRLRRVGQYEADELVDLFNTLMERLKNERLKLREQNEFLDLLIQASPLGVVVLDHDGRITDVNPSGQRYLGIEDASFVRGMQPAEVPGCVRIGLSDIPLRAVRTVRRSDGTILQCRHESFVDRGFVRSFFFIESLTEELRRAEKKAYEKVIRMIAHEVNNSTAGIASAMTTIGEELAEMPDTEELRETMRICVERCYSMSHFITRFAEVVKIPPADPRPTDLNRLVERLSKFMESLCVGKDIRITISTDDRLGLLPIDATLMEQVLLNVVKNAVESIGEQGEIVVCTDATKRSLTVVDNGAGISAETAVKLFSPFFSTKPTGQGLGLLFVREVLTQHRCTYSLTTDPGDGLTRFVILFPR